MKRKLRCSSAAGCESTTCPHKKPHDTLWDCLDLMHCSGASADVICKVVSTTASPIIGPASPDPSRVAVLTRPGGRKGQGGGKGKAPGRVSEPSLDVQMDQADRVRKILEDLLYDAGGVELRGNQELRQQGYFKKAMKRLLAIIRGVE